MKNTKTKRKSPLELPLPFQCTGDYISRRLDLRMSMREAMAYRRVYDGLRADHATLPNGQHVDNQADTVRWILNRIYDEIYGDLEPGTVQPAQW